MAEADKKDDKAKKAAAAPAADAPKEGEAAPAAEGGGDEEAAKKKKQKVVVAAIAGVAILILAVVSIYFGFIRGKHGEAKAGDEHAAAAEGPTESHGEVTGQGGGPSGPIYFELKEFLVNLNSAGKQTSFLKMVVTLELPTVTSKAAVEANMPRIVDAFQVYLRELRTEDLRGSAGIQLLREELLLRINKIIAPEKVNDILFKEIIVQ